MLILLGLVDIGAGLYVGRRKPSRTMTGSKHPGLPLIVIGIVLVSIGGVLTNN